MRLRLISVGTRPPAWVREGYEDYARRMPAWLRLDLIEVPVGKHGRKGASSAEREGARMLVAVPDRARVIALDVRGRSWSTTDLSHRLRSWLDEGDDVAFLIGGPDGLAPACLARAAVHWSLSAHTLPHALVRVIVAEQLYRAWTILEGHPYHRA